MVVHVPHPSYLPWQVQVDRLQRELSEARETARRSEEALRAELRRREEDARAQVRGGSGMPGYRSGEGGGGVPGHRSREGRGMPGHRSGEGVASCPGHQRGLAVSHSRVRGHMEWQPRYDTTQLDVFSLDIVPPRA